MRFMIGDRVQYTGKRFVSDLGSSLGEVVSRVTNSDTDIVVDFGGDAYILNENRSLRAFQGQLKEERAEKRHEVDVQKKKRRNSKQEENAS